ncbi:hypothetical protein MX551_004725 [Salmonella enterica]|nr:hypothetical protein [Salmonella enterica]EJC1135985.1 hypothetical protein [Salmonella enterica]EJC1459600.1 hypothetical protein [Salmonella enterica]
MKNNEKQFRGVLPAVIFLPSSYRQYIVQAKKLYELNIYTVERYCALNFPSYDEGVNIYKDLEYFRNLCCDLMNLDCQHGFYKPDPLDIRRLLGWLDGTTALYKKLANKVSGLEAWV